MLLDVVDLKKNYTSKNQPVEVLKGISFGLEKGQFTSIMGQSGSGKSTLLHLIGGLDQPTSGKIKLNGESIDTYSDERLSKFRRRRLGFVFQFFNLLPALTAVENVSLPLLLDGIPYAKIEPKAKELLDRMGMSHRIHHRSDTLSGGEKQRVALARALVSDPLLILADEPTGNLDSKTGFRVLEILAGLVRDHGHTVLMVTHDSKAASFGSRLIRLRDGVIESDDPVPRNPG